MAYTDNDCFAIYEDSLALFSYDHPGIKDDSLPMPSGATNGHCLKGKPATRHPDQFVPLSSLAFLEQLNRVRPSSFATLA
jgi:hypothetical protein